MTDATHPVAEDTPRKAPPPWPPAALAVLALLLALGLTMAWMARATSLTIGGDDAAYLTLARSLGTGHYRDDFLVGAPPHAQYPPGFPLWLLVVRLVAGDGLDPAIGANLLLVGLTAVLTADALRRIASPWLAVAAAAAIALNPALTELSSQLRAEVLFLACSAVALWASLVAAQGGRRSMVALAWLAGVAAFLTRSIGVTLLPALMAPLLLRRQWRTAGACALAAVATLAGWFRYTAWATSQTIGHSYAIDLARVAAPEGVPAIAARSLANLKYYFIRIVAVPYGLPDLPNTALDNLVVGLLLFGLCVLGGWTLRRRWTALPVYVGLSLVVFLLFPWAFMRFVTAIYPWVLIGTLLGAAAAARTLGLRRPEQAALALGVIIAACGAVGQFRAARFGNACRPAERHLDPACADPEMRSFAAAMRFATVQLPADAVIASSKPSTVFIMSGRRGFPLGRLSDLEGPFAFDGSHPATYLLLTRLLPFEKETIAPRLQAGCTRLTVVQRFPPATLLFGPRGADPSVPDACAEIAHYLELPGPTYELAPLPATAGAVSAP